MAITVTLSNARQAFAATQRRVPEHVTLREAAGKRLAPAAVLALARAALDVNLVNIAYGRLAATSSPDPLA